MKIYRKKTKTQDKIIFEIDFWSDRENPYMPKETEKKLLGQYPTLIGLIVRNRKNSNDFDEIGFAGTVDMFYAGKQDQTSDFIIKWWGTEEDFIKKCGELGLGIDEFLV